MILENLSYFQEVLNPHYAFPVVGVVICALLVFAFGFKTPAQPPSFDFVENRKVATKKKTKPKEIKTTKPVQNGSAHASEPSSNASSAPAKIPSSKPVKNVDAPVPKKNVPIENKSKTKKTESGSPGTADAKTDAAEEVADNTNSGEWTQQLSRKDRKNRKGKEAAVSTKLSNLLTVSSKENSPVESIKETPQEKIEEKGNAEDKENCEDKENVEIKENIETKDVTPSADDIMASRKDEASEEAPSKKSKKKKKEAAPETATTTETAATAPSAKSTKDSNKKSKKAAAKESTKAQSELQKPEAAEEEAAMDMQLQLPETKQVPEKEEEMLEDVVPKAPEREVSPVAKPDTEESAKPTSNVMFDELGDLWQDAKPQKKKKKVRRE